MPKFAEYIVEGKTFYQNDELKEAKLAAKYAQDLANERGSSVRMKIIRGWLQRDPSGFVSDSEEESYTDKVFKPKKGKNPKRRRNQTNAKWIPATAVRMLPGGRVQVKVPKGAIRNPRTPEGHSPTWYKKGLQAGIKARDGKGTTDMYEAWQKAKGKPKTPGARVTAQESFYLGFYYFGNR